MDQTEAPSIPEAEIRRRFGHYQDEAIKGPVLIAREGRPRTVLLSYETFLRLRDGGRRAYSLDDLPEPLLAAILEAAVPDVLEDAPEDPVRP